MTEGTTYFWGTGRRKSSVARVRIKPGTGKIMVNGRDMKTHFQLERDRQEVTEPLQLTEMTSKYDVFVNVRGGGTSGQAGAVKMGMSRALIKADGALEATLREHHMLTRDARMKERKKYGRKGARKGFQYSKR